MVRKEKKYCVCVCAWKLAFVSRLFRGVKERDVSLYLSPLPVCLQCSTLPLLEEVKVKSGVLCSMIWSM